MSDKFEWSSGIKKNLISLRLLGLWPYQNEYGKNLYSIYSKVSFILFACVHNFFQTVYLILVFNDFEKVISVICVILSCIGSMLKTHSFMKNITILKQLFQTLRSEVFQPKNEKQREIMKSSLKLWQTFYNFFGVMCYTCIFFFATYVLFENSEFKLPLAAWYPFEVEKSPNYELLYGHQVIFLFYIIAYNLNVDLFIVSLNIFIGVQCDFLCDNLRNLKEARFESELKDCIKHHKALLKFSSRCNNFYNWILLVQFIASAISMGVSMFQITQVVPFTSEFYTFVSYNVAVIFQIFLYCWFGNEIEFKSSKIIYSVFESEWFKMPSMEKNLIIFTIRSQKTIKLSTLNLFYLSTDTFKMILRTGWSYFALLQTVNKR